MKIIINVYNFYIIDSCFLSKNDIKERSNYTSCFFYKLKVYIFIKCDLFIREI